MHFITFLVKVNPEKRFGRKKLLNVLFSIFYKFTIITAIRESDKFENPKLSKG